MAGTRYGVEIRAAVGADAAEIARLLGTAPAMVAERLEALRATPGNAVLVATGWNALSGVAAVHWFPLLHGDRATAAVSVLVVDAGDRRRGIGRMLLKAVSQAARTGGCDTLEGTPDGEAGEAFCHATGFLPGGTPFSRSLRRRTGGGGER